MIKHNEEKQPRKSNVSRGPFEIWENPTMSEPIPAGSQMGKELIKELIKEYDISRLSDKYGEEVAKEKVAELLESYGGGVSTTLLFAQELVS